MFSGGSTEAISYFSGYLHLFDDIARDREALDGGPGAVADKDYGQHWVDDDGRLDFDDVQTIPLAAPSGLSAEIQQFLRGPFAHHGKAPLDHIPDMPLRFAPQLPLPFDGGGGGGGYEVKIVYHPGGEQSEIEVRQINALFNDDNDVIGGSNGQAIAQQLIQISDQQLSQMIHQASDAVPDSWKLPHDSSAVISAIGAADHNWHDLHDGVSAPSVQPGYYVDGAHVQSAPEALDQTLTSPFDAAPADTGHNLGQWADVGDNHVVNAAQIVDLSASCKTLVVLGDFYSSNAIFQVNGCASSGHAEVEGGSGSTPATINVSPNETVNAAGFIQHASVYAGIEGGTSGHWDVDIVNGNYYNVHTLTQVNYLTDNDVVQQQSSDTHYDVVAGGNQMMNLSDITNGEFRYDLIIVGGSYHSDNFVYQYNILVNNDLLKSFSSAGGEGGQSIDAGGNNLTNAATIDTYGGSNFNSMAGGIEQVVNEIEHGQTNMDPGLASLIQSYSQTLHILYVTGDYYDVNAVWQTNLVEDSNYVSQNMSAAASGNPIADNGPAQQSVIAGHDVLLNLASIVQVGADQTFVGGQAYSDSVLVQAGLVPQTAAGLQSPDPQSLASEVVAFLNDTTLHDPTPQPVVHVTTTTTINDDPMSSVMH